MKPPADMTREELVEELTALRALLYGEVLEADIVKLRQAHRLSPHEARILLCLYRANGRRVSRDFIAEQLPLRWGERKFDWNNVSVHVSRIRSKLGRDVISGPADCSLGWKLTESGQTAVAAALA